MFVFLKIWRALFFFVTPVLRFTLSTYYRRVNVLGISIYSFILLLMEFFQGVLS